MSASDNTYRFSSKEVMTVDAVYYYGYRFYDSARQVWLNRDPLGEDGGINLYGFALNSPISEIDPFGLDPSPRYREKCASLLRAIEGLAAEINKRQGEFRDNKLELPGKVAGDGALGQNPRLSRRGHKNLVDFLKAKKAAKEALYQAICKDPPPSCPAWANALNQLPVSPEAMNAAGEASAYVAAAAGAGAFVIGTGGVGPVIVAGALAVAH